MNISFLLLLTFFTFAISKKHKHKHKHKNISTSTTLATNSATGLIPLPNTNNNCPCASDHNSNACRGGLYVDYYYNAPYSGYPANSSYLPPVDSVPVIVEKLTEIRDIVKAFISNANEEDSDVKKAIYVKNNFDKVRFILKAVNKAANSTNTEDS